MFKKIQDRLLVQYPLLWQSKFIPMLITGLIAWLVAYAWGYAVTNLELIKELSLKHYYVRYFLAIHAIGGIIIYVIWALYFFRTNPVVHFYPLKKNYLVILFFQIVIPLLLIVSLYYPFTKGLYDKTLQILSEKELIEESHIINKAYPFLVVSIEDYKISERVYPEPFPLKSFREMDNDTGWTNENVYLHPIFTKGNFDTTNHYYYPSTTAPYTYISGSPYLFYKSHVFTDNSDTCNTLNYDIIDSFYQLDKSLGLHYYAVQNISHVYLFSLPENTGEAAFPTKGYNHDAGEYFKAQYAPVIYPWIQQSMQDSIRQCLISFKSVCDKYKIKYRLPISELVDTLIKSNFRLTNNLTHENFRTYAVDESERTLAEVDFDDIETMYSNYKMALTMRFDKDIYLGMIIFALALSALILLVFCIDIISFLISIPAAGIILIICGLIGLTIDFDEKLALVVFFIIASFTVFAGFYAIYSTTLGKRVANILLCLGFYALPFATTFLLAVIYEFSEELVTVCGQDHTIHHFEFVPWHAILLGLLVYLLYLPLLKKLKAKAS